MYKMITLKSALLQIIFVVSSIISTQAIARDFDCSVIYDEYDSLMHKEYLKSPEIYVDVAENEFSDVDFLGKQKGKLTLHPDHNNLGVAIFRTDQQLYGKMLINWMPSADVLSATEEQPVNTNTEKPDTDKEEQATGDTAATEAESQDSLNAPSDDQLLEGATVEVIDANSPYLLIQEIILYHRVSDGFAPVRYGPIVIKPGAGFDLDQFDEDNVVINTSVDPSLSAAHLKSLDADDVNTTVGLDILVSLENGKLTLKSNEPARIKFPISSMCK